MSDARALAEELERLLTVLVREGGRLGFVERTQLSPMQRFALAAVVDGGPLRLGALADAVGTTDATATRTVQALERDGLVVRSRDAADGRGVVIAATAEGRRRVARGRRRTVQLVERLLADVDADDRARLIELLRAVTGAVAR
jgi:DNA-binding MarR family transcriptional regulator